MPIAHRVATTLPPTLESKISNTDEVPNSRWRAQKAPTQRTKTLTIGCSNLNFHLLSTGSHITWDIYDAWADGASKPSPHPQSTSVRLLSALISISLSIHMHQRLLKHIAHAHCSPRHTQNRQRIHRPGFRLAQYVCGFYVGVWSPGKPGTDVGKQVSWNICMERFVSVRVGEGASGYAGRRVKVESGWQGEPERLVGDDLRAVVKGFARWVLTYWAAAAVTGNC